MKHKKLIALLVMIFALSLCACGSSDKSDAGDGMVTCTVAVDCTTVYERLDEFSEYEPVVPEGGIVIAEMEVTLPAGSSVYDFLLEAAKQSNIAVSHEGSDALANFYIDGINGLFEFDCGDLSGWMYFVDGESPNKTCGDYIVGDGQKIEFRYTCNLGEDLGAAYEEEQ